MKLCMPTNSNEGLNAEICEHFGSAPCFTLYDQELAAIEVIDNLKADHAHGQCRPMDLLGNRGIIAVLCKGMGKNAVAAVERQGIKVFSTSGETVRGAIDEFMAGRLKKINAEGACTGHACL